ncbi:MAG: serine/threonine protein kinase [Polyangiaceae bacterium]|nr:serine/threonine protein kinase [Polyangiaceae bacterium]
MGNFSRTFAKYRLLARLGHGGMADVYLSVSSGPGGFNKLQVLKVLRPHLTEQPEFLQMFQDEGRLAARLNHPNIVQTNEIGAEGQRFFIAMEYLDGQPLHRVKARARESAAGFPLEMELFVLCQVLEGLEYAHGLKDYDGTPLNIVHRDVTPQNVFVTYAGQTKLVDFGIAKTLESTETQSGVLKGKVAYMAPEQALRDGLDHRADLFSVGVMLWEAVANRRMYNTRAEVEILHKLIQGEIPKIRDVVPDLPLQLEQVIERALALKPEHRYQDAASFRADLFAFLEAFRKISGRDVGERVSELFSEERTEIGEVIRHEMTDVTGPDAMPTSPETMELPSLRGSSLAGYATPSSRGSSLVDVQAPVNLPLESPPEPAGKRWLFPALAGVLLLGVAGLAMFAFTRGNEEALDPAAASSDLATKSTPAAAGSVKVHIEVSPPEAKLTLDGVALKDNPYESKYSRDENVHKLEISAPGYAKRELDLRWDRDVDLRLELAKQSEGAPPEEPETPAAGQVRTPRVGQGTAKPAETQSGDPFGDLPPVKKPKPKAPTLDKTDPWE